MPDIKKEIQLIEESWEEIKTLSNDGMTLLQISYEIGVSYDTLKLNASKLALEHQVLSGNITAIQTQINISDAEVFAAIKKRVWDL